MSLTNQLPDNIIIKSTKRRGQILVLFAFFFVFIFGIFVANYNIGDLVRKKIQLQNAADAASLAASRTLGLGMGYLVIINDMVLGELSIGLVTIITELAIPIVGWALVIPTAIALFAKLDADFIMANSYLAASPFLAQEAAAVMGKANGAEYAWTLLDDNITGVNTGSGARLSLNVPAVDDWSNIYSDIFLHLVWPRKDERFPERAVVIAWNRSSENVLLGGNTMSVKRKNMYATSSSTIYYVPQAFSETFHTGFQGTNNYNGRMTALTDAWYVWAPWFAGPYWQPRLIPNNNFDPTRIGYLPMYADYTTAHQRMLDHDLGLGIKATNAISIIKDFSDTFGFLGDAMSAINKVRSE